MYLSAFLVSQDNFTLGEVFIAEDQKSAGKNTKVTVSVEYDEKYQDMLDQFIELYTSKKAVCRLNAYQDNIRFIMHLVNTRKSGITGAYVGRPCKK